MPQFFEPHIRRKFILQLIAFGVLANGVIIVSTSLFTELFLRTTDRFTGLITSLPLLIGLTLIYLATLLRRRKRAAWLVVLPIYALVLSINVTQLILFAGDRHMTLLHVVRNLVVPGVVVSGLIHYRKEFTVRSDIQSFKLAARTSLLVLLIALAYGISGFLLMDRHDFRLEISVPEAIHRTVDQFDLTTNYSLTPYTRRARLFLDSLSIISTGAVAYVFVSLFQPIRARLSDQAHNRELAKQLLERYPASSEDFFKLWPYDKLYFFDKSRQAFLAYQVRSGVALVVGDPGGKASLFAGLIKEFQTFCHLNDWLPAFIHTEPRHKKLYEKQGFALQKIGEEAVLNLDHFDQQVKNSKYFRQIANKFAKQGYSSELLRPPHNQAILQRLHDVTTDWLTLPGRTERGFMMGYFSSEYMQLCDVMVLRDAAGTIQAFINHIPTYDPAEANYDLLRQTKQAPTNSNDFLLMNFIDYLHQQAFKRFNLGLCPLAGLDNEDQERTVIDSTLGFVYSNGDRFYSFSGLRKFKAKYEPEWSSRYIAYQGGLRGFTRSLNALSRLMAKVAKNK